VLGLVVAEKVGTLIQRGGCGGLHAGIDEVSGSENKLATILAHILAAHVLATGILTASILATAVLATRILAAARVLTTARVLATIHHFF
jgi:hypothetical protein